MCKFCEPWNKKAKEVETDDDVLYLPLALARNVTDGDSEWAINNNIKCLQEGYTFSIDPRC